jgi:hypothetical protein
MSERETYAVIRLGVLNFTVSKFTLARAEGIHQTSFNTMRKSLDGNFGVVKWTGSPLDVPLNIAPNVVAFYRHAEILALLEKPEWNRDVETRPTLLATAGAMTKKHAKKIAAAAIAAAAAGSALWFYL